MKRTLLFFCLFIFFTFTCFNRYTPITLQEAKPTLMQMEIKENIQNNEVYNIKRKRCGGDSRKTRSQTHFY